MDLFERVNVFAEKVFSPVFVRYAPMIPDIYNCINTAVKASNTAISQTNMTYRLPILIVPSFSSEMAAKELKKRLDIDTSPEKELMRKHLRVIEIISVLSMMFSTLGISILTQLIGYMFPLYYSVRKQQRQDNTDTRDWLVYWVVYSTFAFFESLFGIILTFIPMYHYIKLGFLIALVKFEKFSNFLYTGIVLRFHNKYNSSVDELLTSARQNLSSINTSKED
uniref:TB2/DP1, HVA22 family protein n=1 Tax=Megaviridae environmental sample TaxID=1737588 RepID=A0A5J6VIE2_9VIRU|nr:MAG: TB2/DP1, HVA22 family protein [Megaviridae environmental sample]